MRKLLLGVLCMTVGCATTPSSSTSSTSSGAPEASARPGVKDSATVDELKAGSEKARESKDWARLQSLSRELARREPDNGEALAYAGMASIMLGQKEEGIAELEKSVTVEDSAAVRYILASVLQGEEQLQRALEHLERAVVLDEGAVQLWYDLALLRARLGMLDGAFAAAERVKALAPKAAQTESLGMFLAQWHAATRMPQEAAAHNARGAKLALEGRMDEALAEFEAAVKVAPDYADARYNLAQLLTKKGDKARAEQEYRKAIPGFHEREKALRADAQNNLAFLLVERGVKGEEPVTLARAAIETRGERPSYLDTLARACDARGDKACAVDAFRKLLASSETLPFDVRTHAEQRLKTLAP
ncbi:tetratricopeptide repeat protein [Archangium violaceum]|uniref:tetratricopeptide repeat protein n=1 Tax=Archangium violaceum TaxID=83451 RepID=UPI00193B076E|nr:tetratricopeptide repeat protein [Archangium violaceum]QRK12678.1 tetratricopeptide repeat protein [Archangium violaceum]